MMSLFLAMVIGWYLVIASVFMLVRHEQLHQVMSDVVAQRGLFFIAAIMTLILGLLMVVSHNLWVMGWPVLITIISWLVLLSGVLRMFCPDSARKMVQFFQEHPLRLKVAAVIYFIIGLFLLLKAYAIV